MVHPQNVQLLNVHGVTKRPVIGRPVTGHPVTGRQDYQTSSVPNVKITVAIATHMLALGHSAVFVLLC